VDVFTVAVFTVDHFTMDVSSVDVITDNGKFIFRAVRICLQDEVKTLSTRNSHAALMMKTWSRNILVLPIYWKAGVVLFVLLSHPVCALYAALQCTGSHGVWGTSQHRHSWMRQSWREAAVKVFQFFFTPSWWYVILHVADKKDIFKVK